MYATVISGGITRRYSDDSVRPHRRRRTDWSILSTMWRQSAPTLNTSLLGPTCICLTTNGIWIGSSVSAGLTVATDEHRQKTGRQDECRKSLYLALCGDAD